MKALQGRFVIPIMDCPLNKNRSIIKFKKAKLKWQNTTLLILRKRRLIIEAS